MKQKHFISEIQNHDVYGDVNPEEQEKQKRLKEREYKTTPEIRKYPLTEDECYSMAMPPQRMPSAYILFFEVNILCVINNVYDLPPEHPYVIDKIKKELQEYLQKPIDRIDLLHIRKSFNDKEHWQGQARTNPSMAYFTLAPVKVVNLTDK